MTDRAMAPRCAEFRRRPSTSTSARHWGDGRSPPVERRPWLPVGRDPPSAGPSARRGGGDDGERSRVIAVTTGLGAREDEGARSGATARPPSGAALGRGISLHVGGQHFPRR